MKRIFLFIPLILLSACATRNHDAATDANSPNSGQLAMTPQMGWNSWNKFQGRVSEQLIRETA